MFEPKKIDIYTIIINFYIKKYIDLNNLIVEFE